MIMKARDYRPSMQVQRLIQMINESRPNPSWLPDQERRFNDGTRHGMNLILRALVELETEIDDPELIDDVCADLITEDLINRC